MTINDNSNLVLAADATYNGTLSLASGGNFTRLQIDGARSLSGTATVQMSNHLNNQISGRNLSGDSLTVGSGITVQGAGTIGGNNLSLVNNGSLIATQPLGITLTSGGTVTNNHVIRGDGAGFSITGTNLNQGSSGVLDAVNNDTVRLTGNSTITGGTFTTGSGGQIATQSGNTAGVSGVTNTGTLNIVENSTLALNGTLTNNGSVNLQSGGNLTNLSTTGNRLIDGTGTINLSNDANNRIVAAAAGNSLTLGSGQTLQGAGQIGAGGPLNFTNNGTVIGNLPNAMTFSSTGTVTNNNIVRADGGTVTITGAGTNFGQGALGVIDAANSGIVLLTGNSTVTGGTLTTGSSGQITTQSGNTAGVSGVTNTGTLNVVDFSTLVVSGTVTNNGALNLNSGGNTTTLRVAGNATLGGTGITTLSNHAGNRILAQSTGDQLTNGVGHTIQGSGSFGGGSAMSIVNQGTITANQANALTIEVGVGQTVQNQFGGLMQATGFGQVLTLNNVIANNGTIAANGGVVYANAGFTGTGTASTSGSGHLNVDAASTVGTLINNGDYTNALNLKANNITVSGDYTNANSGSGNTFNRRANVTGTGQILAGGDATQAITGATVTNGNTANATLTIGNVRVGANTVGYQVANTGSTGPSLRGAIQTNVNGGNLTDARLSGVGVTAANYNTGAPGGNTGNLGVTFTAASAGALAPLTGQVLNLRSNFDNVADQKLNIVLGSGAAAYNAAVGSAAPSPVVVANQRMGGTATQALTLTNTAPAGAFTEGLNASFGANVGRATNTGGSITLLAGGASNATSMVVGVDTASAGAKSGSVTLNYISDGTGTSGLSAIAAGSQVINVSGNVYHVAAGVSLVSPLQVANQRVGGGNTATVVIANGAIGPSGFAEDLNASISGTTGTATGSGSIAGRLAGTANTGSGAITVGVDTTTSGLRGGNVSLLYETAGTVGGVSNGLAAAFTGSGAVGVSGNVYQVAVGQLNTSPLNFGTVQVGQVVSQTLSLTNTATGAAGFVEDLNASFGASHGTGASQISGAGSINGLLAGGTNAAAMVVTVNTGTAGAINGGIGVNYVSAGAVNGVSNGLGTLAVGAADFGVLGLIQTSGQVINQAAPVIDLSPINLGKVRIGAASPVGSVSVTNQATTAPQAALNASISGNASIIAAGSFTLLAPEEIGDVPRSIR